MKRNNSYLIGNKFALGAGPNRTSFKPGDVPWNKGKTGWCPEGCKATQFKAGCRGNRFVPDGTIRIRTDKNGAKRRWIKFSGKWMMYASYLWTKCHGPIAPGWFIHHIDGDSLHDSLSNYALVTRRMHINEHRAKLIVGRMKPGQKVGKGYIKLAQARCNVTPGLALA